MNFSGYFCLIAAAVLVVFSHQSEAIITHLAPANSSVDPSIKIREGFSNGTQMLSDARSIFLDGVLAAGKILRNNPEGARKLAQQSLLDGESIIYNAGPHFFAAIAEVLGLSIGGSRQSLLSASKYVQRGGLAVLNAFKSGESLFNDGSEAGGSAAKASLNVYQLAIKTGFAAMFYDTEKSANESLQALRDAQSSSIQLQIENRNCGAGAKEDPDCSDALQDINQAAKNALKNGANPALVQELRKIVKCALDSLVEIVTDAKRVLASIKTIAEIDTFAGATMTSKEVESFEKRINQVFAQLYLDFGDVCNRSGNQSAKEVQPAYAVLEKGNVKINNAVKFIEQIAVNGMENGGDASMLAFESVAKSIYFAELIFIQSLVECAKILLSLL